MERVTVPTVAGMVTAAKGASIGASVGTLLGPVGTVVGGFVGGVVGYMAGSAVGDKVTQGAQRLRTAAWNTVKKVGRSVSSGLRNLKRGTKRLFWFS